MTPDQIREAFAYVDGMQAAPSTQRKTLLKLGIKASYKPHQGSKQIEKGKSRQERLLARDGANLESWVKAGGLDGRR